MLISAVMPVMSIYRLPLGQYGYTGHVINLVPQDVVSFAHSLPRQPSELDVLEDSEQSHRDFRVRRTVVHEALTWLLENNRYYRANAVHLNEEALQQLPQDGNLTDIQSLHLGDTGLSHLKISMEPISLPHSSPMLHSKEQSRSQCSSPFKTYRVDHPTPLCGPPLEELQLMSSPQRDTSVWPSLHCSPLELQTFWDSAAIR